MYNQTEKIKIIRIGEDMNLSTNEIMPISNIRKAITTQKC